ncbi:hypothetical protein V9T40_006164 [Parthenolecanium corni]|uniref:UV excision repair protein RAD23 n=1 Tax=Parthenolecanium corni TaxID=536013 RepID=A0AAN9TVG4_9HEMI
MKITIKNLQQQTFEVELDESNTVQQLKEKIQSIKGDTYPVSCQRLIYAGKILSDEKPISEYNIDEKKFVVVMVCKAKTQPEAKAGASTSASSESVEKEPEKTEKKAESASSATTASSGSSANPAPPVASAESTLLTGDAYDKTVQNIVQMGYSRDEVEQALRASFNNPERAVEYLINGIPSNPDLEPADNTPPPAQRTDEAEPLAFLRNQPQFQQMRAVVQQDPDLLNAVLLQIGQTNPALLQLISQNQEAFVRMLNEPVSPGSAASRTGSESAGGNLGSDSDDVANLAAALGNTAVQVTPQDKEAIERLKALGFPEDLVIQAYFACEKNENNAANFLLSQNMDD